MLMKQVGLFTITTDGGGAGAVFLPTQSAVAASMTLLKLQQRWLDSYLLFFYHLNEIRNIIPILLVTYIVELKL